MLHESDNTIVLERFAYSPDGTFGKMYVPGGFECYTVELPWKDNQPRVSCIPEGMYGLGKRYSPVVQRSSGGEFEVGWEVQNVPGRSLIMIHPGNWPSNFMGCIGTGKAYAVISGKNGVTSSRDTFRELMAELETRKDWQILITQKRIIQE